MDETRKPHQQGAGPGQPGQPKHPDDQTQIPSGQGTGRGSGLYDDGTPDDNDLPGDGRSGFLEEPDVVPGRPASIPGSDPRNDGFDPIEADPDRADADLDPDLLGEDEDYPENEDLNPSTLPPFTRSTPV